MLWCSVPGCTSDGRKKGRYGYMADVVFFPFPTKFKDPKLRKKWLDQIMRKDYDPARSHRVCSLHFVDGKPSDANPVPTLFPRNNFGKPERERNVSYITKRHTLDQKQHPVLPTEDHTYSKSVSLGLPMFPPVTRMEIVVDMDNCNHHSHSDSLSSACHGEASDHRYSSISVTDPPEYIDHGIQTDLSCLDISYMEERIKIMDAHKDLHVRDQFVKKVTESDENAQNYTGVPTKCQLYIFDASNEDADEPQPSSGKKSSGKAAVQCSGDAHQKEEEKTIVSTYSLRSPFLSQTEKKTSNINTRGDNTKDLLKVKIGDTKKVNSKTITDVKSNPTTGKNVKVVSPSRGASASRAASSLRGASSSKVSRGTSSSKSASSSSSRGGYPQEVLYQEVPEVKVEVQ